MYTPPSFFHKKFYVDEILRILQENESREDVILIKKLIVEHIIGSSIMEQNQLYNIFKRKVLRMRNYENVSIISFNFDSLLCEDFDDGFCFDYTLRFIYSDSSYRGIICEKVERANYIPLLKLNGSLDWGICPKCKILIQFNPKINGNHYDYNSCKCGQQIEPFIVIPHEEYGPLIKPLWDKAATVLKQADKITIIGYSFPEYDTRVIDLFRKNIRKSAAIKVIDVSDPSEKKEILIREQYRRLFPDHENKININLDGFEGYLDAY